MVVFNPAVKEYDDVFFVELLRERTSYLFQDNCHRLRVARNTVKLVVSIACFFIF